MAYGCCPHHESIDHRVSALEEDMKKWDGRVWVGMWALIGTMATGLASLGLALWMALNIPGQLDKLSKQAANNKLSYDQSIVDLGNKEK